MTARVAPIRIAAWARYPWLLHAFSTRAGGVSTVYGGRTLNLGWTKEDGPEAVVENRRLFMSSLGEMPGKSIATLRQVHGTAIHRIASAEQQMQSAEGRALFEGDGLTTAVPDVLLGIQTADCVPVMIVDVKQRVVAVLHAGWRGTAAGIAQHGVERMETEFGSRLEDIVAAVGPSIGPCCYRVGEEVRMACLASFSRGEELLRHEFLDLWKANRRQLVNAGVAAKCIWVVGECTACARTEERERRYFSHRAEQGVTGRMMSVVGVRNSQ